MPLRGAPMSIMPCAPRLVGMPQGMSHSIYMRPRPASRNCTAGMAFAMLPATCRQKETPALVAVVRPPRDRGHRRR